MVTGMAAWFPCCLHCGADCIVQRVPGPSAHGAPCPAGCNDQEPAP